MEETIWNGGFYELTMEFLATIELQQVVQILNEAPHFTGFWRERTSYHEKPALFASDQLYGYLSIDDVKLPCLISLIQVEGQSNWLDISIPQGAFSEQFDYQYPLTIENNEWLKKVRDYFVHLAQHVYASHPFLLAVIGEEASGYTTAAEFSTDCIAHYTFIMSREMYKQLDYANNEVEFSDDLVICYTE